jgi:hypothetical protein
MGRDRGENAPVIPLHSEWRAATLYIPASRDGATGTGKGKLPEGGKPGQVRDMIKSLLIERFHCLTGSYDFSFKLTDEDYMVMQIRAGLSAGYPMPPQALKMLDIPSDDSLHSGLQSVGLKLDPRKAPLPVLVIDKADKTPTDN